MHSLRFIGNFNSILTRPLIIYTIYYCLSTFFLNAPDHSDLLVEIIMALCNLQDEVDTPSLTYQVIRIYYLRCCREPALACDYTGRSWLLPVSNDLMSREAEMCHESVSCEKILISPWSNSLDHGVQEESEPKPLILKHVYLSPYLSQTFQTHILAIKCIITQVKREDVFMANN